MIEPTIAKKLKDADFQTFEYKKNEEMNEFLPNPSLEELIEACGDKFTQLQAPTKISKQWSAVYVPGGFRELDNFPEGTTLTEGSTPSEAVANLWLALNKVDTTP